MILEVHREQFHFAFCCAAVNTCGATTPWFLEQQQYVQDCTAVEEVLSTT